MRLKHKNTRHQACIGNKENIVRIAPAALVRNTENTINAVVTSDSSMARRDNVEHKAPTELYYEKPEYSDEIEGHI